MIKILIIQLIYTLVLSCNHLLSQLIQAPAGPFLQVLRMMKRLEIPLTIKHPQLSIGPARRLSLFSLELAMSLDFKLMIRSSLTIWAILASQTWTFSLPQTQISLILTQVLLVSAEASNITQTPTSLE